MYQNTIYSRLFPFLKQEQGQVPPEQPNMAQPEAPPMQYDQPQVDPTHRFQPDVRERYGATAPVEPAVFAEEEIDLSSPQPQEEIGDAFAQAYSSPQYDTAPDNNALRPANAAEYVQSMPSTMERPEPSVRNGKKAAPQMPDFSHITDPDEREHEEQSWLAKNATDKDKGWKARLKEFAQNFAFGMSQGDPDMDWKARLALGGIAGGLGSTVARDWNERRDAQSKIPYIRDKVNYNQGVRAKNAQITNQEAQPEQKRLEFERKVRRDEADRLYKEEMLSLGDAKAKSAHEYRMAIIDLKERGMYAQAEQFEKKLAEMIRSNKVKEGQAAEKLSFNERKLLLETASRPIIDQLKDKKISPALRSRLEAKLNQLQDEFENDDND